MKKQKFYEIRTGTITPEVPAHEGAPSQPATYNPDARIINVVAVDVADAISKVTLQPGEHIESVARHNFIDVV